MNSFPHASADRTKDSRCRFSARFKIEFGTNHSTGIWPPARSARRALARRAHLIAPLESDPGPSGCVPWRMTRAGRAGREGEQPAIALGSAASCGCAALHALVARRRLLAGAFARAKSAGSCSLHLSARLAPWSFSFMSELALRLDRGFADARTRRIPGPAPPATCDRGRARTG